MLIKKNKNKSNQIKSVSISQEIPTLICEQSTEQTMNGNSIQSISSLINRYDRLQLKH